MGDQVVTSCPCSAWVDDGELVNCELPAGHEGEHASARVLERDRPEWFTRPPPAGAAA